MDPYKVLGLSKDATYDSVKKAFRELALRYHPDKNDSTDAEERFKIIRRAYETLSTAMQNASHPTRQEHPSASRANRQGSGGCSCGSCQQPRGQDPRDGVFSHFFRQSPIYEAFERMYCYGETHPSGAQNQGSYFGAGQSGRCYGRTSYGPDEKKLYLTFEEVVQGCVKTVKYMSFDSPAGIANPKVEERVLHVTVPPGTPEGSRIAVKSEYCVPEQSTLVFVVRYKPHPLFKRRGADIFYLASVTIGRLRSGNDLEVPTLSGSKTTLPLSGVPTAGSIIRLHGYGLPQPVNPKKRGDLVVGIDVVSRHA
ncbi:hypothetical protein HPB50_017028 [Hyalomma asiaticum]|uniref:Uncharacterized protein n=1 Tax=Hyalomma asiaticum TaxID=266040 RepID=A0ACB7RL87_HYAAI|nr:hypothetical protein HPB50_017028 [Hyalomma asiaticum]